MSATLYALVILQGTSLQFNPGFTSLQECASQYIGPRQLCFPYDPGGTTWSAFFQMDGTIRRSSLLIPRRRR